MLRSFLPLLFFTALSACSHHQRHGLLAGDQYVSLGSSFAAGPGVSDLAENSPKRCGQSTQNYARQVARAMKLSLTDKACSGATSQHILNSWNELPPQIDAVTSNTRLVTIIIGGNDLGYIGGLMTKACEHHDRISEDPMKNKCLESFPLPTEDDYAATEESMNEIAVRIRTKAPSAVLVFIDHAQVLPSEGVCDAAPVTLEDAAESSAIATRLAAITKRVADNNDAYLIQTSLLSKNHHVCSDNPWVFGYADAAWTFDKVPFHPKREAMDLITEELLKILEPGL